MLFLRLHKHIVDYIFASYFKHLTPTLPPTKHMIKPIQLILQRCLNFYLILIYVFDLLVLLLSAAWLEFNQHLTQSYIYSQFVLVVHSMSLDCSHLTILWSVFSFRQRRFTYSMLHNEYFIKIIIKNIIIRSSAKPNFLANSMANTPTATKFMFAYGHKSHLIEE
jgi:hypothetical protein